MNIIKDKKIILVKGSFILKYNNLWDRILRRNEAGVTIVIDKAMIFTKRKRK